MDSSFSSLYLATTPETHIEEMLEEETPNHSVETIGISEKDGITYILLEDFQHLKFQQGEFSVHLGDATIRKRGGIIEIQGRILTNYSKNENNAAEDNDATEDIGKCETSNTIESPSQIKNELINDYLKNSNKGKKNSNEGKKKDSFLRLSVVCVLCLALIVVVCVVFVLSLDLSLF